MTSAEYQDLVKRLREDEQEEYERENRPNYWSLLCGEAADAIEELLEAAGHDTHR